MSGLFRRYNVVLKKRPILTQTATATSLAGLGDLIVQMSSEKAFNTTKFLGFTAYAGAYSGPLMHFWFGFLARRFHSFPKMKGLLYKQIVHHGFANPFMYATATRARVATAPRRGRHLWRQRTRLTNRCECPSSSTPALPEKQNPEKHS